ncbi:MAG: histidine kinase dimerization/phospho-acceptor domain-containing protein [Candidatus Latescibacterota bacterium]
MVDLKDIHCQLEGLLAQQVLSEDVLRVREALNLSLIRTLPDQIFRLDRDGMFLDFCMNPMPRPTSDLTEAGALSLNDVTCRAFVEPLKKHIVLALDLEEVQCFEYEDRDDSGLHFQEVRVVKEQENVVIVIVRDISARKYLEKQIIQMERLQAFDQLSLGVSHNFNNILTGILGPAQLIEKKSTDERIVRATHIIIRSARRASELI